MAIKLLIGGSPCTHWSIAQKNNRETKAEGIGWDLFENYLIAKEKFKPDFFLYENNKSAAQAIKDQIALELGVEVDPAVRFTYINSALVSAQNRQRFYVTNFGDIQQPEDKGILLKDILEDGFGFGESNGKSYCLTANYLKGQSPEKILKYHEKSHVIEPVGGCSNGKSRPVDAHYSKLETKNWHNRVYNADLNKQQHDYIAELVCGIASRTRVDELGKFKRLEAREDEKANAMTTVQSDSMVAESVGSVCVGEIPGHNGQYRNGKQASQQYRAYSIDGKSVCCDGDSRKYVAIPVEFEGDIPTKAVSCADGKTYSVYQVVDGKITIKEKIYPIKLSDGYYIIRKLTVTECCRLQTMPDNYCKAVSKTQAYKGLGNGWTAEVIIHLLNHAFKDIPRDEEIVILSLYDGIGTGRYCLDKMGFTNIKYHAYEIDKYPMAVANDNYPDIIQYGDAFAVREETWLPPETRSEWLDRLLEVV